MIRKLLILSLLFLLGTSVQAFSPFNPAQSIGAPFTPFSIATGDLDNDGDADAFATDYVGNFATFNNLAGSLTLQSVFASNQTGNRIGSPVDLDNDGLLDVPVVNEESGSITLYWNQGSFAFTPQTIITDAGAHPDDIQTGDLDQDGRLDFVVLHRDASTAPTAFGSIWIYYNQGNHQFSAPVVISNVALNPTGFTIGDLTGDGFPEIVVAERGFFTNKGNAIYVYENNAGGFVPSSQLFYVGTGTGPGHVALLDVDGDAKLDVVTSNAFNSSVTLLLNQGLPSITHLSLGNPITTRTEYAPASIAVLDVDNDSDLDLAIEMAGAHRIGVLINDQTRFTYAGSFPAGTGTNEVRAASIDSQPGLDLVFTNTKDGSGVGVVSHDAALLAASGSGNIGTGNGGPEQILTINGQTGGADRVITVQQGHPFTVGIAKPFTIQGPSTFLIGNKVGIPTGLNDLTIVPKVGVVSINLANPIYTGVTGNTIPYVINQPIEFLIQGGVYDHYNQFQVTNAIILKVV